MTDEGAYNLLIAITGCAYKDYFNGLRMIHAGYFRKTHKVEQIIKNYETAKMFLEGTSMGDYLIGQAEKEIFGRNYER